MDIMRRTICPVCGERFAVHVCDYWPELAAELAAEEDTPEQ